MAEKNRFWTGFWDIVKIQAIICFFSVINILSKYASGFDFLSFKFFFAYAGILFCFLIYAFFWQKLLKKHSLFKVYSNRALLVVYALIWGVVLFLEKITLFNIIGVVIIVAGIMVVFSDDK